MADVETHIRKALFYNTEHVSQPVAREVIELNCRLAGHRRSTVRAKLDELVERGDVIATDGGYLPADA